MDAPRAVVIPCVWMHGEDASLLPATRFHCFMATELSCFWGTLVYCRLSKGASAVRNASSSFCLIRFLFWSFIADTLASQIHRSVLDRHVRKRPSSHSPITSRILASETNVVMTRGRSESTTT